MASAMNFDSSILEGIIKFREKKTWKRRFCVIRRLSPVANSLIMQLYKKPFNKTKGGGQIKASVNLEHLLGIENCFQLQKESQTLAVICKAAITIMAFDSREMLLEWQAQIAEILGHSERYEVQLLSLPAKVEITSGSAILHIRDWQFSLIQGNPPRLVGFWNVADLRRFGAVDDHKFCFEGGSRCSARGIGGLFVLGSAHSHEISNKLDYAGRGRLSDCQRSRVQPASSTLSGLLTPVTRHRLSANCRSQPMSKPSTPVLSMNRRMAEFCLSPPCARHIRSASQQHSRASSISSGTRVSCSTGLHQLHQSDPEILYDKPRSLNATTTQAIYETPGGNEYSRPSSAQPYSHYDTPRRILQHLNAERNRIDEHPPAISLNTAVYATVTKPKKVKPPPDAEATKSEGPMEIQGYLVMQRNHGQWTEPQDYVRMQALPCSPGALLQRDQERQHQQELGVTTSTSQKWTEQVYQNSMWLNLQSSGAASTYQKSTVLHCTFPKSRHPIHGTLPLIHSRSLADDQNAVNLRLRRSASMPAESSCRQGNRDSSDSTDSGVSVTANDSLHPMVPGAAGCAQHHLLLTRHWSSLPRPYGQQHCSRMQSESCFRRNVSALPDPSTAIPQTMSQEPLDTHSSNSSISNILDQLESVKVSVSPIGYETCV